HEGLVRVRQELAGHVEFSSVNLLDKQYNVPGPFDAIFCRNVMIYFDKTTQQDILHRFVPLLKPDGLLFAGHSENFSNLVREFSLRGQTVYAHAPGKDKA
ncbi:CheR family methyltransferase, partial [Citrobacter sp. S55_ASV_140]